MNYLDVINYGNKILKLNNIKSYSLDSELLLSKTLNISREEILINLDKKITINQIKKYKSFIIRRKHKEPIAQILCKKEFWGNDFYVNKDVLIPRPETEIIVEAVLKYINTNSSKNLLEIGTGSGCIIISIIKERPNSKAIAIDISKKALKVARYNVKMHHLMNKIKLINIDIDKFNHNKYDFIISNPPYIKKFELKRLDNNVKLFEPKIALEAGTDGFKNIRKIITRSKSLLKKNGKLIFEIGENQSDYAGLLLRKNGFYINEVINDMFSIPRVIISTKIL